MSSIYIFGTRSRSEYQAMKKALTEYDNIEVNNTTHLDENDRVIYQLRMKANKDTITRIRLKAYELTKPLSIRRNV